MHILSAWEPDTALSGNSRIASGASRLCRPHCGDPVFVDLDDVAAGVRAARKSLEALRSPEDDRVGVGAGLNRVPLFELSVEERVQPAPARTEGIDLAHAREYRKPSASEIDGTGRATAVGHVLRSLDSPVEQEREILKRAVTLFARETDRRWNFTGPRAGYSTQSWLSSTPHCGLYW